MKRCMVLMMALGLTFAAHATDPPVYEDCPTGSTEFVSSVGDAWFCSYEGAGGTEYVAFETPEGTTYLWEDTMDPNLGGVRQTSYVPAGGACEPDGTNGTPCFFLCPDGDFDACEACVRKAHRNQQQQCHDYWTVENGCASCEADCNRGASSIYHMNVIQCGLMAEGWQGPL